LPIIIVLLWVWFNPRVFTEPKSTNNWASKIVLGEWVWMNRKNVPVPKHHQSAPNILSAVGLISIPFFIWGLIALDIWPAVFGAIVAMLSKLWFADRMVWLYEEMKDTKPEYRNWLY
jgi:Family of unknown function (DUF6653)